MSVKPWLHAVAVVSVRPHHKGHMQPHTYVKFYKPRLKATAPSPGPEEAPSCGRAPGPFRATSAGLRGAGAQPRLAAAHRTAFSLYFPLISTTPEPRRLPALPSRPRAPTSSFIAPHGLVRAPAPAAGASGAPRARPRARPQPRARPRARRAPHSPLRTAPAPPRPRPRPPARAGARLRGGDGAMLGARSPAEGMEPS